mgnify:CR=1 FL=1
MPMVLNLGGAEAKGPSHGRAVFTGPCRGHLKVEVSMVEGVVEVEGECICV